MHIFSYLFLRPFDVRGHPSFLAPLVSHVVTLLPWVKLQQLTFNVLKILVILVAEPVIRSGGMDTHSEPSPRELDFSVVIKMYGSPFLCTILYL